MIGEDAGNSSSPIRYSLLQEMPVCGCGDTTLPWPGESLNAEFKRPVLEISKTTAANVKPLWLKRNELS